MNWLRILLFLTGLIMIISGLLKIERILYFFAKFNLFYDLFGINGVRVTTTALGIVFVSYALGWIC